MSNKSGFTLTYVPNGLPIKKDEEKYLQVMQGPLTDPVSAEDVKTKILKDGESLFREYATLPTLWTSGLGDCAAIATYNSDNRSYSLVHLSGGKLDKDEPWGKLVKDTIGSKGYILLIGGSLSSSEEAMDEFKKRVKANLAYHEILVPEEAFEYYTKYGDPNNLEVDADSDEDINEEDIIGKVDHVAHHESNNQQDDQVRLEPSSFVLSPTGHYGRIFWRGKTGTKEPAMRNDSYEEYLHPPKPVSIEIMSFTSQAVGVISSPAAAAAPAGPRIARRAPAPASASVVAVVRPPALRETEAPKPPK